MVVTASGPFDCLLEPQESDAGDLQSRLRGDLVGKQVKTGITQELKLYWALEDCRALTSSRLGSDTIRLRKVDNEEESFLAVYPDGLEMLTLTLRIHDPDSIQWRLVDRIPAADLEYSRRILKAAARFQHILNLPMDKKWSHGFKIEFNELVEKKNRDAFEEPFLVKRNLYEDGKVQIVVGDPDILYGINLVNKSPTEVSVTVLFFGCSELSIGAFLV